jgi:hypothetical protein
MLNGYINFKIKAEDNEYFKIKARQHSKIINQEEYKKKVKN